jgi:divinyl protochlorophyllide a 8-vinyl-reductase
LLPVLRQAGGDGLVSTLLTAAGLSAPPDGTAMIPEGDAARLHHALRLNCPETAPAMAFEAGRRTADYILANRIPRLAQRILRPLPASLAAPVLSRAISRNAWTFAGSGVFTRHSPWHFTIVGNPLALDEASDTPLCTWHCAVFERLYRVLVGPDCRCTETRCSAQTGSDRCVFVITRSGA